jgi:hypothetical protein
MSTNLTPPSAKFQSEIAPAQEEYLADPLNERKANNLARAIDHHLDWTFEYYHREGGDRSRLMGASDLWDFRRKLFDLCPELRMMWDLSDAAHHRILDRPATPERVVVVSSMAYSTQDGTLLVPDYARQFRDAVPQAVEFWSQWQD